MLGINSNINSLVAQQNLSGSQSALSQAITRLSSGKRINSAADDAAGLAIATGMQTQINGLNQGVSNANDGVSMVQTASSGLAQITSSLQRIRTLAVQASSGSLTSANQASLQQEVSQQIAEVNRIASQTTYNGKSILDGSAGVVNFQVGANVGQSMSLNLTQSLSAASLGGGFAQSGNVLGTFTGLSLTAAGAATAAGATPAITQINVLADGKGGFAYTDQNNQSISSTATTALFQTAAGAGGAMTLSAVAASALDPATQLSSISTANAATPPTASGVVLGTIQGINVSGTTGLDVTPGTAGAITSVTIKSDGAGGFTFADQNGATLASGAATGLFNVTAGTSPAGSTIAFATAPTSQFANVDNNNQLSTVANVNVSSATSANQAIESIDNALSTVNNIQAQLGAVQNRFTAIATGQQAQSTDLSQAQSQIQDANFAQETANLSKAQVLQQAGISVLAQANSLPQQVLKLLQ
ncbi:flagellin N-terminal helical domain-containing protein [Paraburkholderia kirstenboschensis]|uniref:Flagellin n=1 Tax=Paraburkholderia kirstenboschensis TaxID=1245436 RepID=A0ABZ0EL67_9BURK|nr:flagellin [Paraburkholderia kirstenboschensis]WOD17913.1 flagellin [Paraburkholderia kirstenboschensis]